MTQDTALDGSPPQARCPVCSRIVEVWMGALRIHVPPALQCMLLIPSLEHPDEGKRCARPAGHLGPCECVGIAIDLESRAAMCKGSRSVPVSDWELRQLAEKVIEAARKVYGMPSPLSQPLKDLATHMGMDVTAKAPQG